MGLENESNLSRERKMEDREREKEFGEKEEIFILLRDILLCSM
jgi:hypothetical protein